MKIKKNRFLLGALLISAAVLSGSLYIRNHLSGGTKQAAAGVSTITVGVYPGYTFPADITAYTDLAGRKPDVVFWFQSWSEPLYYSSQIAAIDASGIMPQITWSPEGISLSSLNSGSYDGYIATAAAAAKSYGKPMQIRLAHEFNGPWQTFCPCVNGQTNAQFISFWKRTVDIFRSSGVTNVSWVWSPNIYVAGSTGGAVAFDPMYPGDGYVDWAGLDGYNFGPPNNPWQSLLSVFKSSYTDIAALTAKPLMLAEWGSTENSGDKAAWIRQGFLTDLPAQMPRIRQVDVFDRIAESDFRINSSDSALAAYKDVVNSPLYGGPQPASTVSSSAGPASSGKNPAKLPATSTAKSDSKPAALSSSGKTDGQEQSPAAQNGSLQAQSSGQSTETKTKLDRARSKAVWIFVSLLTAAALTAAYVLKLRR